MTGQADSLMQSTPYAYLDYVTDEMLANAPDPDEPIQGLRRNREQRRGRAGQGGRRGRGRVMHQGVQAEGNAWAGQANEEEDDEDEGMDDCGRRDNLLPVTMNSSFDEDESGPSTGSYGTHTTSSSYGAPPTTQFGEYSSYGVVSFAPASFQYQNYTTPASAVYDPTQPGSSYQQPQPHMHNYEPRPTYNNMPSSHPIHDFHRGESSDQGGRQLELPTMDEFLPQPVQQQRRRQSTRRGRPTLCGTGSRHHHPGYKHICSFPNLYCHSIYCF